MDEKELEQILKVAKTESDRFFSKWEPEPCRRKIRLRTGAPSYNRCFSLVGFKRLGAGLVCLLIALWFSNISGILPFNQKKEIGNGSNTVIPLNQQHIALDEGRENQYIDFIPINKPGDRGQSLMAVLWGLNSEGDYKVMYSSLFDDSRWPYPVATLDFPGTGNRLLLISTGDSMKKFLHYRLIGYRNQAVSTYLEENYVPGGKLGIREGMLVEERTGSSTGNGGDGSIDITYIIPYIIDSTGELILSTEQVRLNVGDQLMLIGCEPDNNVEFYSEENSIKRINKDASSHSAEVRFNALHPGEDYLLLTPKSSTGKGKNLHIKVVE